jgi:hypothetical protein
LTHHLAHADPKKVEDCDKAEGLREDAKQRSLKGGRAESIFGMNKH